MADTNLIPPLKPSKGSKPLLEYGQAGFDGSLEEFYMENGFVVFTEVYHLRRGYCCKNACRHCPYGFRKKS